MITCTLGEKKYTVDFVSGRALREMEPASKMYGRLVRLSQDATEGKDVSQEQLTVTDALDTMVKWFCILFNNGLFICHQFFSEPQIIKSWLDQSNHHVFSPANPELSSRSSNQYSTIIPESPAIKER